MTLPERLSDVRFYGGSICFVMHLDFGSSLAEQDRQHDLDRHLAEVFYHGADFCLSLGWFDESGVADGHYPDGQFILSITGGQATLREWRTRDLLELRRFVLEARDLAARLAPRRDLPTELLELAPGAPAALVNQADLFLRGQLPGYTVTQHRRWHVSGDVVAWTALPPLTLPDAEALSGALQGWVWEHRKFASAYSLENWTERLRRSATF
ncbi:hypothetical protein [Deinococcus radiophilus]|uniref:Uncharacterized protein n=1 Tax=Deinococcus radiophilus TaxID=32062 RepID=A0A431W3F3_9DEIO|nr:hypothetical protein [Deinococcus radiophilus]RTR29912.1 hypothetical protein EJ104_02925 [Deinococcus radiophilus]UFA49734.1 hypothetical protein LMT64_07485 [Deinococcus radiophilus]